MFFFRHIAELNCRGDGKSSTFFWKKNIGKPDKKYFQLLEFLRFFFQKNKVVKKPLKTLIVDDLLLAQNRVPNRLVFSNAMIFKSLWGWG